MTYERVSVGYEPPAALLYHSFEFLDILIKFCTVNTSLIIISTSFNNFCRCFLLSYIIQHSHENVTLERAHKYENLQHSQVVSAAKYVFLKHTDTKQ